jgi:uncharacterized protein YecT (DUF1311 family)
MNTFSKFSFSVVAILMFGSSTLMAASTSLSYNDFMLKDGEKAEVMLAIKASCPNETDDTTAQDKVKCRDKEIVRNETQLDAIYKRKIKQLPKKAQKKLRSEEHAWTSTRYNECLHSREDNLGGALRNVVYRDCVLFELKRRTLWIERHE